MRIRTLLFVLAFLAVGPPLVLETATETLAAPARGEPPREFADGAKAASTQFCMGDNQNRIFKLNHIVVLAIGQLWATPVNGFVFGTLVIDRQTGQHTIKITFLDPVVGPPTWTCQGTGTSYGSYFGTCKSGQLVLSWGTYYIPVCPF